MSAYIVAPQAREDLLAIWHYYAGEIGDEALAERMTAEFIDAFHKLAQTPGLGHFRGDLAAEPVRFWAVRK